jgi:hypothetical protein
VNVFFIQHERIFKKRVRVSRSEFCYFSMVIPQLAFTTLYKNTLDTLMGKVLVGNC